MGIIWNYYDFIGASAAGWTEFGISFNIRGGVVLEIIISMIVYTFVIEKKYGKDKE